MRCECPTLMRCCLCLPLRFGLIGAGCIKIGLDLFILILLVSEVWRFDSRAPLTAKIVWGVAVLLLSIDLIFNTLLLYGCFKKDPAKLRVFYRYCIFLLVINILLALIIVVFGLVLMFMWPLVWIFFIYPAIMTLIFSTMGIFLTLYLSILVRSEAQKLENNMQFQFTNNAIGACAMTEQGEDLQYSAACKGDNV